MAEPIISLKNASITYNIAGNIIQALDDVSLDIYPEEYIIFFGPSGCGKSTLLYAISGLEHLTGGSAWVAGHDIAHQTPEEQVEFHRHAVGMVFQAYYLIPSVSVRANVALPQIFLGKPKPERIELTEELLNRFGILTQKGKLPSQLSGGQQQRVAIARSLVNNPPILLADEPVGNLDSKSAEDVLKLLQELNEKDKKTIIMVTHNPNHLAYAHRVFYMKDGKVIREVKNEKREQVREETMQPFHNEGLNELLKLFPHLDESDIKVKLVVHYLLEKMDADVEEKVEKLIRSYLENSITPQQFFTEACKPLRDGGAGLYHPHAKKLVDEVVAIAGMSRYLKKNFGTFPRSYDEYKKILDRVSSYLALVSNAHLDEKHMERFQGVIKGRLEGSLNKAEFTSLVDRPFEEKGVGLNIRTARNMARIFELILVDYSTFTKSAEADTSQAETGGGKTVGPSAADASSSGKKLLIEIETTSQPSASSNGAVASIPIPPPPESNATVPVTSTPKIPLPPPASSTPVVAAKSMKIAIRKVAPPDAPTTHNLPRKLKIVPEKSFQIYTS